MKSVFKNVAPIAMTITFALSGVVMADTATTAAKSADSATVTTAESVKPPVHHLHKLEEKKSERMEAKNAVAPIIADKSATTKPAVVDKVATAEKSKAVEPAKAK